ncbi:hypothetical protein BCD64_07190 [Nostoc sp. MBR 210]|nr:hypothetical protein BCD64_07190 [Nostoc sp. MBR 210]
MLSRRRQEAGGRRQEAGGRRQKEKSFPINSGLTAVRRKIKSFGKGVRAKSSQKSKVREFLTFNF